MNQELYFLRSTEQYLAKELLLYAVHLDEKETNLDGYPGLEQYQQHFGSYNGDIGVYILADGKVAGGAWARILANGIGHVNHDTPELVLAVKPEFKRKGIGHALMQQLFIEIAKVFPQVSVSVRDMKPVISFYEKLGFTRVNDSEHTNAAGISSFIMLKIFEKTEKEKEVKHLEEECFRKSFTPSN